MQNLVSNLKWKYLNCGKRCSCNNNNRQKTYHRSCVELSLFSMKTKEETGIKRSAYCEKCCSYLQFFFGNKILHYNHLKIQIDIYFSFSFFSAFFSKHTFPVPVVRIRTFFPIKKIFKFLPILIYIFIQ